MSSARGRPTLVDNLDWRHAAALSALLERAPGQPLLIATGYVSLGGLDLLARALDERPLRLLIGAVSAEPRQAGVRPAVSEALQAVTENLLAERNRDNFPPRPSRGD